MSARRPHRWNAPAPGIGGLLTRAVLLTTAALLAFAPAPTHAVILAPGDGTANTTAPADDFGFANVGAMEETGVYLGNGWVLTANHVKARDIRFGDTVYEPVPRSKRRLKNAGGGVSPDVALFRLREPLPELPTLPIRATSPARGDRVVLVGNGPNRGEPTEFQGHRGWHWGEGNQLRWGTNHVDATGFSVQAGGPGDLTVAFSTRLSIGHPTEHESTVGTGDSGGGAFIHDGSRWELAGLLFATRPYEDQPARTTLYGNLSFAADLAHYRDQVLAIAGVPACRDGLDDDGDGFVDFPADPGCDHPDDRQERSVCRTPRTPGDANGDGRATGDDYTVWTQHYGERLRDGGEPPDRGDFDCDGVVGVADFEIWREQYRLDRDTGKSR